MPLIIIGVISLVVSLVSFLSLKGKNKQLLTVNIAESATVSDLEKSAHEIGSDEVLGVGHFTKDVKINGVIKSDNPIKSELSQSDCVWYSNEVKRVYEVTRIEKDSDGNTKNVVDEEEVTVSQNVKKTDFYIDDGTGRIEVSMDGLHFDKEKSFDEYRPYEEANKQGFNFKIGSFSFNMQGNQNLPGSSRTLGFKSEEKILPLNKKVFIVGEVRDVDHKLRLYKPRQRHYTYSMTFGTETELIRKLEDSAKTLGKVVTIAGAIGGVLVILGIILKVAGVM